MSERHDDTVHVFLCADARHLPAAAVTVTSVIANASPGTPIHFRCLFEGDAPDGAVFRSEAWAGHVVELIPADSAFRGIDRGDHLSSASLLRLAIPDLFPGVARGIYLDADMIVLGDIRELARSNLGGKALGGVRDFPLFWAHRREKLQGHALTLAAYLRDELGLDIETCDYFNTGMMVMDLDALRRLDFTNRTRAFVGSDQARLRWLDQDAINATMQGRMQALDPRWNAMQVVLFRPTGDEGADAAELDIKGQQRANPLLLHFAGAPKPWEATNGMPSAAIWWDYALRTSPDWKRRQLRVRLVDLASRPLRWLKAATRQIVVSSFLLTTLTSAALRPFGRGDGLKAAYAARRNRHPQ